MAGMRRRLAKLLAAALKVMERWRARVKKIQAGEGAAAGKKLIAAGRAACGSTTEVNLLLPSTRGFGKAHPRDENGVVFIRGSICNSNCRTPDGFVRIVLWLVSIFFCLEFRD